MTVDVVRAGVTPSRAACIPKRTACAASPQLLLTFVTPLLSMLLLDWHRSYRKAWYRLNIELSRRWHFGRRLYRYVTGCAGHASSAGQSLSEVL